MIINSHVHLDSFMNLENNKLVIKKEYFKIDSDSKFAVDIKDLNFRYTIQKIIFLKI